MERGHNTVGMNIGKNDRPDRDPYAFPQSAGSDLVIGVGSHSAITLE